MDKEIVIKNARENNLKGIDVTIPRDKFVVLTGLSGSGKSSLAFDTIYAEGQRRYMESLSSYARQFLGRMEKADVEMITGLSPAIAIDQKSTHNNPRSTVGTVTEIYDYLRLLFARVGVPHCPVCGKEIVPMDLDQIVNKILNSDKGDKVQILAPVVKARKGRHDKILERIAADGYTRVRVDGEIKNLADDEISLEKNYKHSIDIVIDRIKINADIRPRLSEAVELAIKEGEGEVTALYSGKDGEICESYNTKFSCSEHGSGITELEPRIFSFNSPQGACETCKGIGHIQHIDPKLIIKDESLSLSNGALSTIYHSIEYSGIYKKMVEELADYHGVSMSTPYKDLPAKFKQELLYGTGKRDLSYEYRSLSGNVYSKKHPFEGLINNLERRYMNAKSDFFKDKMGKYMHETVCSDCDGKRLKKEVLAVKVGGINIHEFTEMSAVDALGFIEKLSLEGKDELIAKEIIKQIRTRLQFLVDVGLDYLTLSRAAGTLSGGEAQRIRLATQIGSGLVGVLYVLDEPSIGLHQKDNLKLLDTLRHLTDIGNTLIVVEHDEETMYAADHIVDIGPGAGVHGGELVASGDVEAIKKVKDSVTGQYLSGAKKISSKLQYRKGNGKKITIKGAAENNLKNINVDIPLGKLVCVTGVSGSGKSTLVNQILHKGASNILHGSTHEVGKHKSIKGIEHIDKIVDIDQSPIGRTPRSNPATYTGVFTPIRDLFAGLKEAKIRGFSKRRFSFNLQGGRCEACKGDGIIKIEMHFLPDVYVPCDVCGGMRYNQETLKVKYKDKSIFDVLDMSVDEAKVFFENIPTIKRILDTISDVGLGYIRLGQPSTQLSGGEAQRIKLASELAKKSTGRTLYILDEPTTGLHFADVDKLIAVLERLTDTGNTVVVIEHNLDVIKRADHIIDLGPDGGSNGGEIVATGTPLEVSRVKKSYTGHYLQPLLK
ncbi:excinuclease ABC, A subunit [Eubacterium saphenum ATCC 49989]|nr:excinuclease ABC, A subunit [Eubacterium saphenum ATCC 49989]